MQYTVSSCLYRFRPRLPRWHHFDSYECSSHVLRWPNKLKSLKAYLEKKGREAYAIPLLIMFVSYNEYHVKPRQDSGLKINILKTIR